MTRATPSPFGAAVAARRRCLAPSVLGSNCGALINPRTSQTKNRRKAGFLFGAPGVITRAAPSPLRGRRRCATALSRACGARLKLPTAWFVARPHNYTCFTNQSLAVLAHPIPYLSYQSLALHWYFTLAQNWHSPFCPLKYPNFHNADVSPFNSCLP